MEDRTFKTEILIQAAPAKVWAVMADVGRWPEWTPGSITLVETDRQGPVVQGQKAKVHQPKLRPAQWQVTKAEEGKGFDWVSGNFLLRASAGHWIRQEGDACRVVLTVSFEGWLAGGVVKKYGTLTQDYMRQEAEGLKRRCEEGK